MTDQPFKPEDVPVTELGKELRGIVEALRLADDHIEPSVVDTIACAADTLDRLAHNLDAANEEIAGLRAHHHDAELAFDRCAQLEADRLKSPSQICRESHFQNCGCCDRMDCGDNTSPAKALLDQYKAACEEALAILDHIGSMECYCDESVGFTCEAHEGKDRARDIRAALAAHGKLGEGK